MFCQGITLSASSKEFLPQSCSTPTSAIHFTNYDEISDNIPVDVPIDNSPVSATPADVAVNSNIPIETPVCSTSVGIVVDRNLPDDVSVMEDETPVGPTVISPPAGAAVISNLPDDVNAMVDANNNNILADQYNVEFLGDGSCLIYARDGIDVDTHGENIDDVTSSIHLGVCANSDCHDEVFIACPPCLNFLCFDHQDSSCEFHTSNIPEIDTHASPRAGSHFIIVVDDATGAELKVPVINCDEFEMSNKNDNMILEADKEIHDEDNDDAFRSRKRVQRKISHPESWGRNVAKSSHLKGCQYKKARGILGSATVPPKSVQPCNCNKCRYKCSEIFSDDDREQICKQFYELADYSRQKDFIINHVVEMPTKTVAKNSQQHRQVSRAFYLTNNAKRIRVCGNFFCKTLDLKIRSVQKYFTVHRGSIGLGSVVDGHGRHAPPNKTADWKLNLIRKHIESFPTMESHYCRADSTRLYLDAKLTIRKMYAAFIPFFRENLPPLMALANGSVKQCTIRKDISDCILL